MASKVDFQYLRSASILLLVSVVISTLFIVAGILFADQQQAEYEQARKTLRGSHTRYKVLVQDIDLLAQFRQSYSHYHDTGLIGGERRLSWIETLEKVNDSLRLPMLTYELSSQEEFVRPKLKKEKQIEVRSTPMLLKMELLHEGDLFSLLDGIEQGIDNLFTVDSCHLTRISGVDALLSTQKANLQGNCLLRWVTVDVK